jgi:hypothetical protein
MKRFATLRLGAARTVLALSLLAGAVSAGGHAVTNTADKAKAAM